MCIICINNTCTCTYVCTHAAKLIIIIRTCTCIPCVYLRMYMYMYMTYMYIHVPCTRNTVMYMYAQYKNSHLCGDILSTSIPDNVVHVEVIKSHR